MNYFIAALAFLPLLGCTKKESYYIEVTDTVNDIVFVNSIDRFDTREECQSRVVWIIANDFDPDVEATTTYRCIENER